MKIRPLVVAAAGLVVAVLLGQELRRGVTLAAPSPPVATPLAGATPRAAPATPEVAPPPLPTPAEPPAPQGRAPAEWQGMLVDEAVRPPCGEAARCGLARACVDGECRGCRADAECAGGEICALEHCVRRDLAGCRARRDCGGDDLCVLSGYSAGPRGNELLTARCLAPKGGRAEQPTVPRQVEAAPPIPVRPDELLRSLEIPGSFTATSAAIPSPSPAKSSTTRE